MGLEVISRKYVPIIGSAENITPSKVEKNSSVFEEAKTTKKEDAQLENNNEEASVWGKIKQWFKNPFKATGFACAGAGIGMMSLLLGSTITPVTAGIALLGFFALFVGGCTIAQGYEVEKTKEYDKKADEHLEQMKKDKLDQKDEEQLDSSTITDVEKLYGTQKLVAFKTKNGAVSAKVNVPLALKLNEILEKYSTKDSPEITTAEQEELLKETNELFREVKQKAASSHIATNKEYAFGQYNNARALQIAESKEEEFKKLIAEYTQEKSSNGKNIDKSELLDLREKMFASINGNK